MIFKAIVHTAEYHKAMRQLTKAQLPRVQVASINSIARVVHSASERNLGERTILRNKYTVKSLRFSPAKVRSGGRVGYAETGSISPYLPIQETGGTEKAARRKIAIPTTAIRLGKRRQGVIMTKFRLNRVGDIRTPSERGMKRAKYGSGGSRMFFAPFRKPGFYFRSGKRLIMARDLSQKSVKVKATHWHTDAVKKFGTQSLMEAVFAREARKIIGAKQ